LLKEKWFLERISKHVATSCIECEVVEKRSTAYKGLGYIILPEGFNRYSIVDVYDESPYNDGASPLCWSDDGDELGPHIVNVDKTRCFPRGYCQVLFKL